MFAHFQRTLRLFVCVCHLAKMAYIMKVTLGNRPTHACVWATFKKLLFSFKFVPKKVVQFKSRNEGAVSFSSRNQSITFRMGHSRTLFLYLFSSFRQLTVKYVMNIKFCRWLGFDIGSDHAVNWATTTTQYRYNVATKNVKNGVPP